MLLGEVVDELLDENRLAHAGATEESGFAAADVGLEQVNGLDARLEDLGLGGQLVKGGRGMVDGIPILHLGHVLAIDGLAHDVPDAAEGVLAHGHLHRSARVHDLDAALQAVRGAHGHATNDIARKLALNLQHGLDVTDGGIGVHRQGVVDVGNAPLELDVHHRADDAHDAPDAGGLRLLDGDGLCH